MAGDGAAAFSSKAAFRAMIRRSKARQARAAALVDKALAMPVPRLVLVKGDRKVLLCRNTYGSPYRMTWFDERGPISHLEFNESDRKGWLSMDSEIASLLFSRYRVEKRKAA